MLEINQPAPNFEATNQNDEFINNKSLLGKKYILFFYGQDDTPTCTKQVCMANNVFGQIKAKGFEVYGVSPDSVKKHQKFIEKYELTIGLLSDPSKAIMYAFGAYGPKIFMGKNVIGVYRKTYFINEKGLIIGKIDEVKAANQGEQILAVLNTL
jgi:thioredoxin-dependent peroxiredoxin